MNKKPESAASCPVETTLGVIGGKWKVLILYHLQAGPKRFGELHRALRGISHRTLAKQLRELESDGVLNRKVFNQIPPKVEYSLTPWGKRLGPVLGAMDAWGRRFERERIPEALPRTKFRRQQT